jgi:hypothetical protein
MSGFLASYWYYKRHDFTNVPGPLILDSGAFSAFTQGATITLDELSAFYHRVRAEAPDSLEWALNLDVLGDHFASIKNWWDLAANGVPTVPVVHFTSPIPIEQQLADYLTDDPERIAFGGMVGEIAAVNAWAAHGLRWLRDNSPETLVHGLGVGPWVKRAKLPWDSTDCSDFALAYRFGYARMPNPAGRKPLDIRLGTGFPPSRTAALVIRRYGIEPRECTSGTPSIRCAALARMAFRASEHEEMLENARRKAAGIRPVTRYVVDGANPYGDPVIFEEMRRAAVSGPYQPRRVPGIVHPTLATRQPKRAS